VRAFIQVVFHAVRCDPFLYSLPISIDLILPDVERSDVVLKQLRFVALASGVFAGFPFSLDTWIFIHGHSVWRTIPGIYVVYI
jgi:hypothetical protein